MATCSISGCDAAVVARGWCRKHYGRWHRHGDPLAERTRQACEVDGCDRLRFGHGLCEMHYRRKRTTGSTEKRDDPRRKDRMQGEFRECASCRMALPLSAFHADAGRWDGLRAICRDCDRERRRERETFEFIARRNERRKARRDAQLDEARAKRRAAYAIDPSRQRAYTQSRRAAKRDPEAEAFEDREIFERDEWTCQLCTQQIDPSLRWPHPNSASLDHIIPLARGGKHRRDNTQASHLVCNLRKKDRMP